MGVLVPGDRPVRAGHRRTGVREAGLGGHPPVLHPGPRSRHIPERGDDGQSTGLSSCARRAAEGLEEFLDQVKHQITEAQVAGFDETGLRVEGKLDWVHCARTDKYTLITCHAKRGREGIDDAGVLGRFRRSQCATPGPRMTPISMWSINSAAPTRCASFRASSRSGHRMRTGVGPARPPTRSWPCNSWWVRRSPQVPTPSMPKQVQLYR
jgi:Transposase IS66 family